ncbi:ribose-phosphate diphosphokinase [Thermofilum pendens]|uniref:ribose-phosphate diphosphokinase n=1 Tax=Thermofilum pendens TaxID=2269 RepID=UPI00069A4B5C|nr:ribose-phosphate diphosphokinase [Thermofilum pendens]
MTVYSLESSNGIAAQVARGLGDELVFVEKKVFPDGEIYVRVPSKPSGVAIVVSSTHPPQERRLLELLLTVEALSSYAQGSVIAVVPYLAYARQDKRFLEGEPISIKVVLKALEAAGASGLLAVDVHQPRVLSEWLSIPSKNVLPFEDIAGYLYGKVKNAVVLAPDMGALERARRVAELIGADFDYLVKERDRVTGEVRVQPKSLEVNGRDVVIVDDIISTGKTIALAAKSALAQGASSVTAVCTHAVMVQGALDLLYYSGVREVVATDTVPSPVSKISVAPSVVRGLRELLEDMI